MDPLENYKATTTWKVAFWKVAFWEVAFWKVAFWKVAFWKEAFSEAAFSLSEVAFWKVAFRYLSELYSKVRLTSYATLILLTSENFEATLYVQRTQSIMEMKEMITAVYCTQLCTGY